MKQYLCQNQRNGTSFYVWDETLIPSLNHFSEASVWGYKSRVVSTKIMLRNPCEELEKYIDKRVSCMTPTTLRVFSVKHILFYDLSYYGVIHSQYHNNPDNTNVNYSVNTGTRIPNSFETSTQRNIKSFLFYPKENTNRQLFSFNLHYRSLYGPLLVCDFTT